MRHWRSYSVSLVDSELSDSILASTCLDDHGLGGRRKMFVPLHIPDPLSTTRAAISSSSAILSLVAFVTGLCGCGLTQGFVTVIGAGTSSYTPRKGIEALAHSRVLRRLTGNEIF